jgi:hypothetical protein
LIANVEAETDALQDHETYCTSVQNCDKLKGEPLNDLERERMIDWYNLVMNSLWIFACALALATLSYASWQASISGEKFRKQLEQPGYQLFLNIAGLLFCIGLAGTSDVTWQRILWILLAVGFTVQIGVEIYKKFSHTKDGTTE